MHVVPAAAGRRIRAVRLTGLVLRHRAAVYLAVALLTLGGVWALFTLPAGIYPEVTYPRIVVLARGGTFEADADDRRGHPPARGGAERHPRPPAHPHAHRPRLGAS